MSGVLEQETVMGIVEAKNLTFEYIRRDEEGNVEGITTACLLYTSPSPRD